MLTPLGTWCHHWLVSSDVPVTNIRRGPCEWWMIVLFMVGSFVIGCVGRMCQLFLSECVFFYSIIVFGLVTMDFFTFPCLWEISFSSQMISGTVDWLMGLDRIFKWSYDYFSDYNFTPSDTWCHHWLIYCDVLMINIKREACGGWMIVLLTVVSFVIGCVHWMGQSFLSECVFFSS